MTGYLFLSVPLGDPWPRRNLSLIRKRISRLDSGLRPVNGVEHGDRVGLACLALELGRNNFVAPQFMPQ